MFVFICVFVIIKNVVIHWKFRLNLDGFLWIFTATFFFKLKAFMNNRRGITFNMILKYTSSILLAFFCPIVPPSGYLKTIRLGNTFAGKIRSKLCYNVFIFSRNYYSADSPLEQAKAACQAYQDPPGFDVKHINDIIGKNCLNIHAVFCCCGGTHDWSLSFIRVNSGFLALIMILSSTLFWRRI